MNVSRSLGYVCRISFCCLLFLAWVQPVAAQDVVQPPPPGTPDGQPVFISPGEETPAPDIGLSAVDAEAAAYYVILDPGHGGSDPGAPQAQAAATCGIASDNREKDRTLDIALRVRTILSANGVRVGMTRESDVTLSLDARTNFINREMPALSVSIHANSVDPKGNPSNCGSGVEAFYSSIGPGYTTNPNKDASRQLALKLAQKINQKLGLSLRGSDGGAKDGNLQLVREPKVPSALVEMAFMTNATEVALMRNRADDFAQAIAEAIMAQLGLSASCPAGQYRAEYFANRWLSNSPASVRCETWPLDKNWGDGGPGSGIGNDNFSVRWVGSANFTAGSYTFIVKADDGVRLYLDNALIIDGWRDQAPTEYRTTRSISAGAHAIKVEFYENGGGAMFQLRWEQQAGVSCPNQYKAEYFTNRYLSGAPTVTRCENWPINWDWGGGSPVNGIPADNFSVRWTANIGFNSGRYTFTAAGDDGVRAYLDGTQIIDGWRDQGTTEYRNTRDVSAGSHAIKFEYYENGGGAVARFRWDAVASGSSNIANGRPSSSSSNESSNYGASKGNDGSTSTRWSSAVSSTLGKQWWKVDVNNQTFDRVTVRWEAAYAAKYFIGWSNDGTNFTGYYRTISSPGTYSMDVGTRQARYVGVIMETRAPRMNNYSFWEVEVYRVATARAAGEDEAFVEEAPQLSPDGSDTMYGEVSVPDGELVELALGEADMVEWLYLPHINR